MAQPRKADATEILDVSPETFQEILELFYAVQQRNRVFTHQQEGELILMDNIALRCATDKDKVRVFLVYGGRVIKPVAGE